MILIVTNRQDFTVDYTIIELKRQAIPYFRFNTEDFPTKAKLIWHESADSKREIRFDSGRVLDLTKIKSVWYRRPVSSSTNPVLSKAEQDFVEAESRSALLGLWRTLDCFWVSQPDKIREAENKLEQLERVRSIGFKVPKTIVTNDPVSVHEFLEKCDGRTIAKPIRESHISTSEGMKLVYSNFVTEEQKDLIALVKYSPVIFQEYVPKKVEIRVNVFGRKVFATEIHSQESLREDVKHDWRRGVSKDILHKPHLLSKNIESICRKIVNMYGLKFATLDLILTPSDDYYFLEMNPNGQWAWIEPLTKQPLRQAIIDLLTKGENSYG